jgi:phosphate transport system substrate-binding protein
MNMKVWLIVLSAAVYCSCAVIKLKPAPVKDYIPLEEYQPFSENNKAAVLGAKASYRIETDPPVLDGATALYPLYAAFVQAVYPEGEYSFRDTYDNGKRIPSLAGVGGTREAFIHLADGTADIIFCAKPSPEQVEAAAQEGKTFTMTAIGKDAFVFFVHAKNPVSGLTTDEIRGIYSGGITNWSDLGGKKKAIKVYQRARNSGSQTMLESIMGEETILEPQTEDRLGLMLDIITEVADYRNYRTAIGYSFLFYTTRMVKNNNIKLLAIDSVVPSVETIQANTYPYAGYFYAITAGTDNKNVDAFIEWILSEEGQYLVKETGYVPLR